MIARDGTDGRTSTAVYGDLDESSAPRPETFLAADVPVAAELSVVVDLKDCAYISSIAISVLVRAFRSDGDHFRVTIAADGTADRMFRISGLHEISAFPGSPLI